MADFLFGLFIVISLSIGAAVLAFYSENIKKSFIAFMYAFIISLLLYWFIALPAGLGAWVWGLLFIISIGAKLYADTRNPDGNVNVTATV